MPGFCKNCGAPRKEGQKFCTNCGISFEKKEMPPNGAGNQQPYIQQRYVQPPYPQQPPQRNMSPNAGAYRPVPPKKKSHVGAIFALILAAAAVVFVITAFFKPGFLRDKLGLDGKTPVAVENKRQQGKTVNLSKGLMSLNDFSVDFSGTGALDGEAILTEENGASFEKENGLISELYSISYEEGISGLVTVSLPVPEAYDASKGGVLRLGIGRDYTTEDGLVVTPFDYIDAVISNGMVTASFDISMFPETAFFGRADNDGTGFVKTSLSNLNKDTKKRDHGKIKRYLGYFWTDAFYYENGHFKVWHPTLLYIDQSDRQDFLSDLESIYSFYAEKGYMMGDKFPMDVTIQRKIEGMDGYSQGSSITLASPLLFGEENKKEPVYPSHRTASRELLKHEFFHTIQTNYLGWKAGYSWAAGWQESVWFDEATAVYYEANETGKKDCAQSNKYVEYVWEGLMPDDKMSADAGYARGPLVAFVTDKLGSDEWIKTVYNAYYENGTPLNDSIRAYFESIPNAAREFYTGFVSGKYCTKYPGDADHTAGRFFYYIEKNNPDVKAASKSITIAEPDNRVPMEEAIKNRESYTLEERGIDIHGTGAYMFALRFVPIDNVPDDYQVTLYCDGCEVILFEVSESIKEDPDVKLDGKSLSLKQIDKAWENSRYYLALAVSNAPMGEKTNTTFKVVLEPADSSVTGTWSMEGEGSYSSGLIDPLVGLLEKYAGEYDPNDLLGLSGYGDLYRSSLSNSFSDGRMTIQNTGEKNVYDVNIKFGNGAPLQAYRGTYDTSSNVMTLKQKDTNYTDSDGNTVDLEKLGMTATLTFTFGVEKDPSTGKVKQTYTGTGGQSSAVVSTSGTYRGEKLSDSIEPLE